MKKIYLSTTDKKIAGICGGIGQMFDIDPTLVRLASVLLALSTGIVPVLITYVAAWIVIPKQPDE